MCSPHGLPGWTLRRSSTIRAHLSAPTRFLCSWVQSNYSDRILEAFRQDSETIAHLQITLRVNGQARPRLTRNRPKLPQAEAPDNRACAPVAGDAAPGPRQYRPRQGRCPVRQRASTRSMTFDTFVLGSAQRDGAWRRQTDRPCCRQQHRDLQPGLHPFHRGPGQIPPAQRHRLGRRGGRARPRTSSI